MRKFVPNEPGIVLGMSMADYQAAPGISKSGLDLLRRSPKQYAASRLFKREPTEAMRLGTAYHSLFWEQRRDYTVRPEGVDLRTIAGKEWRASLPADTLILTADDAATLEDNVRAAKLHPHVKQFDLGGVEVSFFARAGLEHGGRLLKGRADCCAFNANTRGVTVWDLKTCTDASTRAFSREILTRRYHVQAAMYRRILRALGWDGPFMFWLIALEKSDPALVNVRRLADAAIDLGDCALDEDLSLFHRCTIADNWPDFADQEERPGFIDLPAYVYGDKEQLTGLTAAPAA